MLTRICRHATGRQQLAATDDLFKMGADSMAIIGIVAAIENAFDIVVEEVSINREVFASIASLCTYVSTQLQART